MERISVIIPVKNEPYVKTLVEDIKRVLVDYKYEIIVVYKGSKPSLPDYAKVIDQKSNGLGRAVLEGLSYSTGDIIITMDGDGSHDTKHIPEMLNKMNQYDIVLGSRFVPGGVFEDSLYRKFISKFFRFLVRIIIKVDVKDSMSGFAAVKRVVYDDISLNPIGYKINLEIIYKAKRAGFKVTEVPIAFHKRQSGKSKAWIAEGIKLLLLLLRLRIKGK